MIPLSFKDPQGQNVTLQLPPMLGELEEEEQKQIAGSLVDSWNRGERFVVAGFRNEETGQPQFEKVPQLDTREDTEKMARAMVDFRNWGGEERWSNAISRGVVPSDTPDSIKPILNRAIAEQRLGEDFVGPTQQARTEPTGELAQFQETSPLKTDDPLRQFGNLAEQTVSLFGLSAATPPIYAGKKSYQLLDAVKNAISGEEPVEVDGQIHPVWEEAIRSGDRDRFEAWTGRAAQRLMEDVDGGVLGGYVKQLGSTAGILPYAVVGGPAGMIGAATLSAASEAELAANDVGLEGGQKAAHILTQGGIEGGVTAAFSLIGLPGLEKAAPNALARVLGSRYTSRLASKSFGKAAATRVGSELAEENIITQLQMRTSEGQLGIDYTPGDYLRAHVDASILTTALTGPFAGWEYRHNRRVRLQELADQRERVSDQLAEWTTQSTRAKQTFAKMLEGARFQPLEGVTDYIPSARGSKVFYPQDYYGNTHFSQTPIGQDLNHVRLLLDINDSYGVPIAPKHPAIEAFKGEKVSGVGEVAPGVEIEEEPTFSAANVREISPEVQSKLQQELGDFFSGIEDIEVDEDGTVREVGKVLRDEGKKKEIPATKLEQYTSDLDSLTLRRGAVPGTNIDDAIHIVSIEAKTPGAGVKFLRTLQANFPGVPIYGEGVQPRLAKALNRLGWTKVGKENNFLLMPEKPGFVVPSYEFQTKGKMRDLVQIIAEADHVAQVNNINPIAHHRALSSMIVRWAEKNIQEKSTRNSFIQHAVDRFVKARELYEADFNAIRKKKSDPFSRLIAKLERMNQVKVISETATTKSKKEAKGKKLKPTGFSIEDRHQKMKKAIEDYVERAEKRGEFYNTKQLTQSLIGYVDHLFNKTYEGAEANKAELLDLYFKASGLKQYYQNRRTGGVEKAETTEPTRPIPLELRPQQVEGVPTIEVERPAIGDVREDSQARMGSLHSNFGIVADGQGTVSEIGRWLKKLTYGLGPKSVKDLQLVESNAKAAVTNDINRGLVNWKKAVRDEYGPPKNLEGSVRETMNLALGGSTKALSALKPRTAQAISDMRSHIDALSSQLLNSGVLAEPLQVTVSENLGTYVHRKYKAFDPSVVWYKDWNELPVSIREKATEFFSEVLEVSPDNETMLRFLGNQLLNVTSSTLSPVPAFSDATAYYQAVAETFKDVKNLDLSPLKKKKELHPGLRALWGEYGEVEQRYAQTAQAVSETMARFSFMNSLFNVGMEEGWVKETGDGDTFVQIGDPESENQARRYGPLNGMYTTPEIRDMLQADDPVERSEFIRFLTKSNSLVKKGKVIGSPPAFLRNFEGALVATISNGNLSLTSAEPWRVAARVFKEGIKAETAKPEEETWKSFFTRLGIMDAEVNVQFLNDLAEDASVEDRPGNILTKWVEKLDEVAFSKTRLEEAYLGMDNFLKVVNWFNERKKYSKAYPDATKEWLDEKAADNVQRIMPTYSRLWEVGRMMKKNPILGVSIGSFLSFRLEMWRTTIESYRLAFEEMKDDRTRAIGHSRIGYKTTTMGASNALKLGSLALIGMSLKDDEDLRELLPDFYSGSVFSYVSNYFNEDGVPVYWVVNNSYIDPFQDVLNPIVVGARIYDRTGNLNESLRGAVLAAFEPFGNPEIFTKAAFEAMYDIRTDVGKRISNPEDPRGKQAFDRVMHFVKEVQPGISKQAWDFATGGDKFAEFANFFSVKKFNVRDEYRNKVKEFKWKLGNVRRGQLDDTETRKWLYEKTQSAKRLGLTEKHILKVLLEEDIGRPYIHSALVGVSPRS